MGLCHRDDHRSDLRNHGETEARIYGAAERFLTTDYTD